MASAPPAIFATPCNRISTPRIKRKSKSAMSWTAPASRRAVNKASGMFFPLRIDGSRLNPNESKRMDRLRLSNERGHANHGWLDSYHSFSFADYYDPRYMGWSVLRVINEDRVQPGRGFGTHGHRDMEIVTYVLEGALEHRDSMGNGSVLRPGELQRMSAGTGIRHSEFNPSQTESVHLYQIWLLPGRTGLVPSYEQRGFSDAERNGRLRLVASPDGADGSLTIHQDARLYLSTLGA